MGGCFISRQGAIAYLARRGFSYVSADLTAGAELKRGPAAPDADRKRDSKSAGVGSRVRAKPSPANPRAEEGNSKGDRRTESTGSGSSEKGASPSSTSNSGAPAGKVARLAHVKELTGLRRSSIYNRMDERSKHYDPTFPRRFSLSTNETGAVGWDEEEIKAWVAAQAAARPK